MPHGHVQAGVFRAEALRPQGLHAAGCIAAGQVQAVLLVFIKQIQPEHGAFAGVAQLPHRRAPAVLHAAGAVQLRGIVVLLPLPMGDAARGRQGLHRVHHPLTRVAGHIQRVVLPCLAQPEAVDAGEQGALHFQPAMIFHRQGQMKPLVAGQQPGLPADGHRHGQALRHHGRILRRYRGFPLPLIDAQAGLQGRIQADLRRAGGAGLHRAFFRMQHQPEGRFLRRQMIFDQIILRAFADQFQPAAADRVQCQRHDPVRRVQSGMIHTGGLHSVVLSS